MSLCIGVVTTEGIVVAGESRQTQVVSGMNRIGSDSAVKVFELTPSILAATAGWAFLKPQGSAVWRNISSLMEDFKSTIPEGSSVQRVAALLWTYFDTIYQEHTSQMTGTAVADGQVALEFIVTGYDPGSRFGTLFNVRVPSPAAPLAAARTSNDPNPWWIGQTDVIARILKGYDGRALVLPFAQGSGQVQNIIQQLTSLQYSVSWNTMTIQDAIDFVVAMIQITATIQRFTPGMPTQVVPAGVGGPIDVAVILPEGRVQWVAKKEFHV